MKKLLLLLPFLFIISCQNEKETHSTEPVNISIRLKGDPYQVNPYFSPTSLGREIFQYIYLQVADYHPETMEVVPVLIETIPVGYETTYQNEIVVAYDIKIRPEATWSDGKPILAKDYILALNMINHPSSKARAWKPYFNFLKGAALNKDNKKCTVFYDKDYMLSLESCLNVIPLPHHIYDPELDIVNLDLKRIKAEGYEPDTIENKIIEKINASDKEKLNLVQSGPYKLSSFQDDQYYILDRIPDYWGETINDIPALRSEVDKMTFKIVPDELGALTLAKEGKIDIMSFASGQSFIELKDDAAFSEEWSFHIPQLMRYYYVAINNQHPILSDPQVRNALSRLIDVDDMIETLEKGLGKRLIGPILPSKSYYNDDLPPIPYDVDEANKILDEAGWSKKDGDGIRVKQLEGKTLPLKLELIQTGSELGKNVALLIQESCAKAGIQVDLITKKSSLMRKENLTNFNYDLILLIAGLDSGSYDPYRRWHSDNIADNKGNFVGYSNPIVDKEISELRLKRNSSDRIQNYLKMQEEIYKDQPIIFLYSPLDKIIINKKFKAITTPKRPGYMANTFQS